MEDLADLVVVDKVVKEVHLVMVEREGEEGTMVETMVVPVGVVVMKEPGVTVVEKVVTRELVGVKVEKVGMKAMVEKMEVMKEEEGEQEMEEVMVVKVVIVEGTMEVRVMMVVY